MLAHRKLPASLGSTSLASKSSSSDDVLVLWAVCAERLENKSRPTQFEYVLDFSKQADTWLETTQKNKAGLLTTDLRTMSLAATHSFIEGRRVGFRFFPVSPCFSTR